ncbi:putative peptidoglycan binding domain-containing protein [Hyphomicrobium sp. 99]|uniref:putative peptidoglycan binding domain-containing protein n=1 Tax=Hyphomicrobium sp. 99 TaxID=1163419 RepID=UPI0005F7A396|nr:putative peptidoglycan binding domain-containing protein [Hyphomicrobium sp. 99]
MPRLGGVLLLTATVMVAAYSYLFPASDHTADLNEVVRISAAPDRAHRSETGARVFSSASPVFREVIPEEAAGSAALTSQKPGTWTTVVSSEQAVSSPLKSASPGDPETRAELASDLQRELRRVGCYEGEITGTWNAATRRAMAAFMDRANATLPFDNPDYVLLALLQSHQDIACSAECPSGQISDGGRCVPRAVVAQATKRSKRLEERRLAAARLAGNVSPAVTAEPEKLPWLQNEKVAEAPVAPPPEPLPGRMSVGAPIAETASPPPADDSSRWKPIAIVPEQRDARGSNDSSTVAALGQTGDSDDLSADASTDANAAPLLPVDADAKTHVVKRKSRHSDSYYYDDRPRRKYASGRSRRGAPRPGTARYNLMLSLGGIY